jgi:hypothetical protein
MSLLLQGGRWTLRMHGATIKIEINVLKTVRNRMFPDNVARIFNIESYYILLCEMRNTLKSIDRSTY